MAQDFGDDMGESLRRGIGRAFNMFIREWMRNHKLQQQLDAPNISDSDHKAEEIDQLYDAQKQPEQVYLNFGETTEAKYFAELCRNEGIDIAALNDADGRGFIQFASIDLERVQHVAPKFAELMTRLQIDRVNKTLAAEPVTPDKIKELTKIREHSVASHEIPDREFPKQSKGHNAPSTATSVHHTDRIADEVREMRSQCKTLDELERLLALKGIGTTVSKDGEVMFYEPRLANDGTFLPYNHDRGDWAVGARTLKERYGVDATHDSFIQGNPNVYERSEPQIVDGSLDMDGRTPDLNQSIESHDGMDTDVRTLRIEREQNGTDIAPSKVREKDDYVHDDRSLDSIAKECRAASKQLEHESGVIEHELDVSNKLNPVR